MKTRWRGRPAFLVLLFLVSLLLAPLFPLPLFPVPLFPVPLRSGLWRAPLFGGAPAEEQASKGAGVDLEAPKEAGAGKAPAGPGVEKAPMRPGAEKAAVEPPSIRDRVAAWVFLAWVWGTTIAAIWFLRLKIKECDRLERMAFHEAARRAPQEPPPA